MTDNPVDRYAREVVEGRVPAGKYHKLSCARHLADRARERTPGFPYFFRMREADAFLQFARKLKHYKGRAFAGQPFEPTDCQIFRLGSIFGWREVRTGYRRFTTAYNEVPRKQGKSFEESIVGLYVTFFEGEPGAEGYYIATKEKQARIAFDGAKALVRGAGLGPRFGIRLNASNLSREASNQKLEPIGSDSETTDGLNPHYIGVDELHAFKSRGLLDVMESATGARENPLIFQITTAGDDPVSVGGDQHAYACRILEGVLDDDASTLAFFAFIAHADEDDDPWAESTWIKANPHWGISINPVDLRKQAAKARQMPAAAAEFKQKRLNIWVNSSAACLSVEGWRKGQTSTWTPEDMRHESCYIGLDLSAKIDLCAMSIVFPPAPGRASWRVIQRIWKPAETLRDHVHTDRAPYDIWRDQGWIETTPGVMVDQAVIRAALGEARALYDIESIGLDDWHAHVLINQLIDEDGFTADQVIAVPQTMRGLSAANLTLQAEILGGLVDARGNPVMGWAVGNAVGLGDSKGNLLLTKKKSTGRIDPVMATATAIARYLARPMPVAAVECGIEIF